MMLIERKIGFFFENFSINLIFAMLLLNGKRSIGRKNNMDCLKLAKHACYMALEIE